MATDNKDDMEWTCGRLFDTASAYWRSCALHAAVKLELFTFLGDSTLSAEEVADKAGLDKERGAASLLDALSAMGLLAKIENRYANTSFSYSFLNRQSPDYLGFIIMHHHHLVDAWARLDEAVRSGEPVETRSHGEDRERESFLMGMFNLAVSIAPEAARAINLKDKARLLDLGGGPGTYAIHFCLANPEMKATIFDRKTTEEFALKTVERFGLTDRINFIAGDFNQDDNIHGSYDAAWLSHILHGIGPSECRKLLRKTVNAMVKGGVVMVHEFYLNDRKDGPLFPALFSLNMLVNNPAGRSYCEKEIREMLAEAGIVEVQRAPFAGPNSSGILYGMVA